MHNVYMYNTHMYIYTHTCYINIYTRVYIICISYIRMCTHTHTHTNLGTSKRAGKGQCIYVYMYNKHMYIYTHTCYIYKYIYMCTHTHTHTNLGTSKRAGKGLAVVASGVDETFSALFPRASFRHHLCADVSVFPTKIIFPKKKDQEHTLCIYKALCTIVFGFLLAKN